ncbi:GGDEF domain-containing protein [Antarcticirhabdus aurantiaca]|uniref:GGDEF domain-containing protein n=1 Tax=Antarcticirhabdus aurantiaca TaxID=2606717 RepID=A0ACD4NQ68_9HYPH|nr:GGDEF domain-containing protein [Antarcticirhabdus aurantiaca]WAJ29065.1 GGDEF domain-containing protein [Jeongeuplla avenae]
MTEPRDMVKTMAGEFALLALCLAAICGIAAYYVFEDFGAQVVGLAMGFGVLCAGFAALPLGALVFLRLNSLVRANRVLATAATTDRLTNLLNRATFVSKVQKELRQIRGQYSEFTAYALLVVDADHFKRINDQLGHPVGDAALRAISNVVRRSVRTSDVVGRLGGEEFAVFLRGVDRPAAMLVAERLRRAVEKVEIGEGALARRLSVSIGGVAFTSGESFERLYEIADANLYRAKEGGRNRVEIHALAEPPVIVDNRLLHRRVVPGRA